MQVHLETFLAMNTRVTLLAPGVDTVSGARLMRRLRAAVAAQERRMSRFRADAELARVNARAVERPVRVSAALWRVLSSCADHWRRTRGAFDIAWRAAVQPGEGGFSRVHLDPVARSVHFASPAVSLDLGAIGKGVALRQVQGMLRRAGLTNAVISFGESSILALGAMPNGGDWEIGLAAAQGADASGFGFSLRDASVSTSGAAPGAASIIDPRTGDVASPDRLISVVSRCPIEAEVVSTALLARPTERQWILQEYRPMRVIEVLLERRGGRLESRVAWSHG